MNSTEDMPRPLKAGPSPFAVTLNLIFLFYTNLMVRLLISPLFLSIQDDLGITKGEAGTFFFFLALGFFCTMLASSLPASKLGHRITLLISSAVTAFGAVLIAAGNILFLIKTGFIFIGIGSGLYLPSGVATITRAYGPEKAPSRIALHEIAPTAAFITLPLIVNGLFPLLSWRILFLTAGAVHLLGGCAFLFNSRGIEYRGKLLDIHFIRTLFPQKRFWVITFYFIIFYGSTLGIFSILPTFLASEKGLTLEQANFLTGLSRITLIPALFSVGWILKRTTPGIYIALVFLIGGLSITLAGCASGVVLILFLFLQPAVLGIFPPMGYLFLDKFGPPGSRVQSTMISIIVPFAFLFGNGLFPALLARLADGGMFAAGITGYGILLMVSPIAYFLVTRRSRK